MSTVHFRYEVFDEHGDDGCYAQSKADAFDLAIGRANSEERPIVVFDRMARRGAACRWLVYPGLKPGSGSRTVLPPVELRSRIVHA